MQTLIKETTIFLENYLDFIMWKFKMLDPMTDMLKCLQRVRFPKKDDNRLAVEATTESACASKHFLRGIFYF